MNLVLPDIFIAILALLTGLLGVGRLTRVIVYDDFPPAVWLRIKWDDLVSVQRGPWWAMWNKLLHCWWCLSMWVAVACIVWWTFLNPLHPAWMYAWWVFWGGLALSYAATMVIVRDQRPSDDDE